MNIEHHKNTFERVLPPTDPQLDCDCQQYQHNAEFQHYGLAIQLMDMTGVGALVLGPDSSIRRMNTQATVTINNCTDLHITENRRFQLEISGYRYDAMPYLSTNSARRLLSEQHCTDRKSSVTLSVIKLSDTSRDHLVLLKKTEAKPTVLFDDLAAEYRLTQTESSVLEHILRGLSFKKIAKSRNVSEHTVKTQVKAIYEKTEASSRAELAWLALSRYVPSKKEEEPTYSSL